MEDITEQVTQVVMEPQVFTDRLAHTVVIRQLFPTTATAQQFTLPVNEVEAHLLDQDPQCADR